MELEAERQLPETDALIRRRRFLPRALKEETGITSEPPMRATGEADGYWFTRELTFRIVGLSYRTPQFNLALLETYLNSEVEPQNYIRDSKYVATGYDNLRFETRSGIVKINAREHIDPVRFLAKFGLVPENVL